MNYKTIKRRSTSELVMKEILESIQLGELKPGDQLPTERKLAKMFGVGRSSLREAVSALALAGYIEVVQGRGSFVSKDLTGMDLASFELKDIQAAASIADLIEIREILECHTARLAARRARSDQIEQMKKTVVAMKESTDNIEFFSECDFNLHVILAEASGNQVILQMMKMIVKKVHDAYGKLKHETLFDTDQAIVTADKLIDAIAKQDEASAADSMEKHLNLVTTQLKRVISDKKNPSKNE